MSSDSAYTSTLRRLPLFLDLSDSELALVVAGVSRRHFKPGAVIFEEGDACRELLIVEQGEVKLIKSAANGRQQLLNIERKGSALGEVAALDGGSYPARAEAASDATLLCIPADAFRKICVSNPEMTLKVFKVLAHRLRHLITLVEDLSFSTVRARLIAHLVRLAEQTGKQTEKGIAFQFNENNEELAVRLGTVRELISRTLGRLHGERLIEMDKRIVYIPDLPRLRAEIDRAG